MCTATRFDDCGAAVTLAVIPAVVLDVVPVAADMLVNALSLIIPNTTAPTPSPTPIVPAMASATIAGTGLKDAYSSLEEDTVSVTVGVGDGVLLWVRDGDQVRSWDTDGDAVPTLLDFDKEPEGRVRDEVHDEVTLGVGSESVTEKDTVFVSVTEPSAVNDTTVRETLDDVVALLVGDRLEVQVQDGDQVRDRDRDIVVDLVVVQHVCVRVAVRETDDKCDILAVLVPVMLPEPLSERVRVVETLTDAVLSSDAVGEVLGDGPLLDELKETLNVCDEELDAELLKVRLREPEHEGVPPDTVLVEEVLWESVLDCEMDTERV
jgi:hypothetical protein